MNIKYDMYLPGAPNPRLHFIACIIVLISPFSAFSADTELSGDLIIFHAGSLAVPFKEISEAFMMEHPKVRVLREAAGSRESARKISDLGRPCDIMASADYVVIDTLLIPEHAAWNIKFAGNEMVLAYTEQSRGAETLTRDNWHEVVMRSDIYFGRSDPNADPCGYRTLLTVKLAEKHYVLPGYFETFVQKDLRYVRPKETDLLALLETHTIDYIFIYRSVAEQHQLKWLALPDEINLKSPEREAWYASVSVEISGTAPGTTMTQVGEPMVYGVTIPVNAPNPRAAQAFAAFLLDEDKGLAIMKKNGQPGLVPSPSSTFEHIPEVLKRFALKP